MDYVKQVVDKIVDKPLVINPCGAYTYSMIVVQSQASKGFTMSTDTPTIQAGTILTAKCPDCHNQTLAVDSFQPKTRAVVIVHCLTCATELEINKSAIGKYV